MQFRRYDRGQTNTHTHTQDTGRHTDRHDHHNTLLPYRGRNNMAMFITDSDLTPFARITLQQLSMGYDATNTKQQGR